MLLSSGSRVGGAALALALTNNRANTSRRFKDDLLWERGLPAMAEYQSIQQVLDAAQSRAKKDLPKEVFFITLH